MTEDESSSTGASPTQDARPATPGSDGAISQGGPARVLRRRPSAVTVVAVTYLLMSVAWAVIALRALISAQIFLPPSGGLLDTEKLRSGFTLLAGIAAVRQAAVGVTAFVASIALLRMQPRGWLLAMVAAVIVLAVQLLSWYDAAPNYLLMTFAVVVVLLMNQAEVRDAFGEDVNASQTPP